MRFRGETGTGSDISSTLLNIRKFPNQSISRLRCVRQRQEPGASKFRRCSSSHGSRGCRGCEILLTSDDERFLGFRALAVRRAGTDAKYQ